MRRISCSLIFAHSIVFSTITSKPKLHLQTLCDYNNQRPAPTPFDNPRVLATLAPKPLLENNNEQIYALNGSLGFFDIRDWRYSRWP